MKLTPAGERVARGVEAAAVVVGGAAFNKMVVLLWRHISFYANKNFLTWLNESILPNYVFNCFLILAVKHECLQHMFPRKIIFGRTKVF